jgi:uncharacterized protein YkwD
VVRRLAWLLALSACRGVANPEPAPRPPVALAPEVAAGAPIAAAPLVRPSHRMDRDEAERYVVALLNRDRAVEGRGPLRWDAIAARAARAHADDLAAHGFTAHVGTDGSVPEQRYTAAGGAGLVMENAACYADAKDRPLDLAPTFDAASIEALEAAFVDEKPPADGHRQNILLAQHNAVGVALVQTRGLDRPCLVQELVDDYGVYLAVPRRARVGATLRVAGELRAPAEVGGVAISRVEVRGPASARELGGTGSYVIPKPFASYFPRGWKTPKVLDVQGRTFSIDVPLSDGGRPGLYGVSVWAILPGSPALVLVSLRTISVE